MFDNVISDIPELYPLLKAKGQEIDFTMPSDLHIGSMLKTLVASKPNGNFLELGTGIGLSLSWMAEGMDHNSRLISIDSDPQLIEIAKEHFVSNNQLNLICGNGEDWIENYTGEKFDLIFADTWPGKYHHLEEAIALLKSGGFYVIDDMVPQPNWPEGHEEKAINLVNYLESRTDLRLTKMNWSTGIIIAVKV